MPSLFSTKGVWVVYSMYHGCPLWRAFCPRTLEQGRAKATQPRSSRVKIIQSLLIPILTPEEAGRFADSDLLLDRELSLGWGRQELFHHAINRGVPNG